MGDQQSRSYYILDHRDSPSVVLVFDVHQENVHMALQI